MGNYELLKAAINDVIKANGRQEITGEVLNQVLLSMVNSLGAGYQCMGVATPSTNPGTPDQNVFYFATQTGTYTNFDAIVLQAGISVLIWDGDWASQTWFTVDSAPTNNSQNLIASGAVFNALKLDGGAYDVSAHNSGATFASLSALLNSENLNTLIPTEIRHGGMSIKFVQSSDNKYVRFNLIADEFTTDVTKWQSENLDDIANINSINPIKSSGVKKEANVVYETMLNNVGVGSFSIPINPTSHGSGSDKIKVDIKAGSLISGTISLGNGATITDGSQYQVYYFYSDNTNSHDNYNYPNSNFSKTVAKDVIEIGFYISGITKSGSFDIVLSQSNPALYRNIMAQYGIDISALKTDKGGVCYLLPAADTYPDISTSNRTLTIPHSYALAYNKTWYGSEQDNVVVDLSGVATGAKKIIFDKSNNNFTCVGLTTDLSETQAVVMMIRTDYASDGQFTTVYGYACTCECTIDGQRAINSAIAPIQNAVSAISADVEDILFHITGSIETSISVPVGNHSSLSDNIDIDYKAGTTLTGKISLGTAAWTADALQVYLYDSNKAQVAKKNITIGTEFTISGNQDAKYVGFYISRVTTAGTFDIELEYNGIQKQVNNLETDVATLQEAIIVGNKEGVGSINLKSMFKESLINVNVTSSLFDTTLYSVGNQSLAVYDKYGIYVRCATDRNDSNLQKYGVVIVDLDTKTKLGEFEVVNTDTKVHGNNVSLGVKYDSGDTLPLVYISNTHAPYKCVVIRINNAFDGYTKIQEIVYNGTAHFEYKRSIDWFVDGNYIWAYGAYYGNENPFVEFVKFAKPTTNADAILGDADVIDSFVQYNLNIAQGAFIYDNKIYIGLGYNPGDEWIKVVDTVNKEIVTEISLDYEPEGVTIYNGKVCICGSTFDLKTYEDAR